MLSSAPLSTNKRKFLHDAEEQRAKKLVRSEGGKERSSQRQALRVVTDLEFASPTLDDLLESAYSDADSLFDEPLPSTLTLEQKDGILAPKIGIQPLPELADPSVVPARLTAPPIPGLYFDPTILLPEPLADDLMWTCIRAFFQDGVSNQVMLFERSSPPSSDDPSTSGPNPSTGLPPYLSDLLSLLSDRLRLLVPPEIHDLLFSSYPASHDGPPRARQAIINLYWPGEGITPHVDLLDRYGDGIIGVSLGSGCAMQFAKVQDNATVSGGGLEEDCALYLPKGSVLVMTDDARYGWTHGIEKRSGDIVEEFPGSEGNVFVEREIRLSITFRWLLPGADVVGPSTK
ncbi:hypothetical protein C8Q80DRAFT_1155752 [Daedaleopsis nitida]|nr:hypothetical protein C8Q80DRAFT_1155752 [Daedaleopsis nitida]